LEAATEALGEIGALLQRAYGDPDRRLRSLRLRVHEGIHGEAMANAATEDWNALVIVLQQCPLALRAGDAVRLGGDALRRGGSANTLAWRLCDQGAKQCRDVGDRKHVVDGAAVDSVLRHATRQRIARILDDGEATCAGDRGQARGAVTQTAGKDD